MCPFFTQGASGALWVGVIGLCITFFLWGNLRKIKVGLAISNNWFGNGKWLLKTSSLAHYHNLWKKYVLQCLPALLLLSIAPVVFFSDFGISFFFSQPTSFPNHLSVLHLPPLLLSSPPGKPGFFYTKGVCNFPTEKKKVLQWNDVCVNKNIFYLKSSHQSLSIASFILFQKNRSIFQKGCVWERERRDE